MNLGMCTITRAEIRGAITGLELAWDYGFRRVELQLDSKVAISLLLSQDEPEHQHIFREANKAADFLANHGYNFPFGIHLYTLSDCNLGHILSISEPCLIPVIN
ncbi:Putative ribonuclease H protein At1g65750 [Linum perenne]